MPTQVDKGFFLKKKYITESSNTWEMLLLSERHKWNSTEKRVGPDITS